MLRTKVSGECESDCALQSVLLLAGLDLAVLEGARARSPPQGLRRRRRHRSRVGSAELWGWQLVPPPARWPPRPVLV